MDHNKSKQVLATRMRVAFDDLFTADKNAHHKTAEQLKGWFKTKTGVGDAVAKKIATTFKSLATYADFAARRPDEAGETESGNEQGAKTDARGDSSAALLAAAEAAAARTSTSAGAKSQIGLVYRFEIHLPDTQNVDTYRAIFRALREELM
jgi:hypothetical protein